MNLERPGAVVAAGNAREGDAARGLPSRGRRFERRILDQVGVGGDGHGGAARAALAIVHPERDGPPSGSKGVRRDRGALRADHRAVAEVERVARERPVGVGRGGGVGSHRERGHPGRRGDGQRRLGLPIHVGDREGGERRARESVAGRERHRIGTAPVGEARSPGQGSRGIARAGNEGRVVARRQRREVGGERADRILVRVHGGHVHGDGRALGAGHGRRGDHRCPVGAGEVDRDGVSLEHLAGRHGNVDHLEVERGAGIRDDIIGGDHLPGG